ncbi:MAG TPA: hypothetical protein VNN17_03240 [Terriglobia bacterium]|nr:hypothetical protein [Terriglobia bacterium]
MPPPEDHTRQLWNTQFLRQRPASKPGSAPPAPPAANPSPANEALVGVTIWRLRPSQPGDDRDIRILSSLSSEQWTPVRLGSRLPLAEGERIRISIEAARTGYLYVIDREQYAGGALGAAMPG